MVSIKVTARGFGNNKKLLDALIGGGIDENLAKLLHQLGEDVVAEARNIIQQNGSINSGTLLASTNILEEDPGKSVTVGSTAPHADYIEFGRGPVRPINKKFLHYYTKDGKEVFSKYSGPTEAQPFLQPAVEKHSRIFKDVYAEGSDEYIKEYASSLLDAEEL